MKRLFTLGQNLGLALLLSLTANTHADTTTSNTDPLCADAQLWSGKLITDICWNCLFPIQAAGASLGGGNVPSLASDQVFCFCDDPLGIPQLGMTIGLWNPARLIELVRNPWCSPALGGMTFSASHLRLVATTGKADFDASEMSFFNYHYFAFPLTILLDLFWDNRCNADGYRDFDLMYVSELDPTWNSDLLAFFTSPETALFANPVAISACVADAAAAATGNPLDALFWCAGAWGHMYPLSGISPTSYGTDPRITSLLATRATAALHRRGLAWKTAGNDALCGGTIYLIYQQLFGLMVMPATMPYAVARFIPSYQNRNTGFRCFTRWRKPNPIMPLVRLLLPGVRDALTQGQVKIIYMSYGDFRTVAWACDGIGCVF